MAKKTLAINIRGRRKSWSFKFQGDPKYLAEWREDGLEIDEVYNTIPEWAVNAGLLRVWCFVQDVFHFRNPLKG